MAFFLVVFAIFIFSVFIYFSTVFLLEKERRAAIVALVSGLILSGPIFIVGILFPDNNEIALAMLSIYALGILAFLFPYKKYSFSPSGKPNFQFDERNIMFSRAELVPETERFKEYYLNNAQNKTLDDRFRLKPGLMAKNTLKYHPLKYASANANFEVVHSFIQNINDNKTISDQIETDSQVLSSYIKKWAKHLGVVNVGITILQDYHLYSYKGRGTEYGKKIDKKHSFAIAFTVEMNKYMIDLAPNAETVLESSQQYLNAGAIAAQLAVFIRNLGYSARPHFDGNYEVICPLVARDAGLGEFGRMGLLMTPKLGPRVRIGVVTTDILLVIDSYKEDYSIIDFCTQCKKCADNCPSKAISFLDMEEKDGIQRWTINHEACFTYWTIVGTDCGKCIQVCPYSHPDNLMHNLIRSGIKNSGLFARLALKMDDLFYGRKPDKSKIKSLLD